MKLVTTMNLWNRDQWRHFWYPSNVVGFSMYPTPSWHCPTIVLTLFGFVFFIDVTWWKNDP